MMQYDLCILICTHNRRELLLRTLDSIRNVKSRGFALEVVVVANACSDDTVAAVLRESSGFPFPLRVVEEPIPGLNVARNRAVLEADGAVLAFLDDDVWVHPDWAHGLLEGLQVDGAKVVGGRVDLWWEAISRPDWFDPRLDSLLSCVDAGDTIRPVRPGTLIGANFAFCREIWQQVGGFADGLGRSEGKLLGYEEVEWMERVEACGHTLIYSPRMQVKHWVSPSRVSADYLRKVSWGNGYSRVLSRKRMNAYRYARSALGYGYLFAKHALAGVASRISGNAGSSVVHASGRAMAAGGLAGVRKRLVGV